LKLIFQADLTFHHFSSSRQIYTQQFHAHEYETKADRDQMGVVLSLLDDAEVIMVLYMAPAYSA
jgi:hypothetical protein